jgi:sortase A
MHPVQGSVLGRVEISRLNLSAIVREGVDDATLSRAVGHLPSTALPGETGNFAIAAHRDTLFRALKDIQKDDQVSFESESGTYTYKVVSTKIVKPSDVSVLGPQGDAKLLTMITCYPFYYVGSAPNRFVVQAKEIDVGMPGIQQLNSSKPETQVTYQSTAQPSTEPKSLLAGTQGGRERTRGNDLHQARRIASYGRSRSTHSRVTPSRKKQKFWTKWVHRSRTQ